MVTRDHHMASVRRRSGFSGDSKYKYPRVEYQNRKMKRDMALSRVLLFNMRCLFFQKWSRLKNIFFDLGPLFHRDRFMGQNMPQAMRAVKMEFQAGLRLYFAKGLKKIRTQIYRMHRIFRIGLVSLVPTLPRGNGKQSIQSAPI